MNFLLNKYHDLNREILKNSDGKLMMYYYQLVYFENHLDQVLPEYLIPTLSYGRDLKNGDVRPRFICSSSNGYYYSMGFINMLINSEFDLEYDPCLEDNYTFNLEMENAKKCISLYPISLLEEYSPLYQGYIDMSDGMIFTLVIKNDYNNIESVLDQFHIFYKQVQLQKRLNSFIFTIAITYKDFMEDSFKKMVEEELRIHISHNYNIVNYVIMECNPRKRDQVLRITIESVKRFKFIDTKLFLKYLQIKSEEEKNKKKNCSIM